MKIVTAMLIASSMAGMVVNVVRVATGRPRPYAHVEDRFYGLKKDGRWIVRSARYKSFPSAHTATATAFVGVLLFAGIRGGWLLVLLSPAVGFARIYSDAHHFSDVMVSIILGLLLARWAHALVCREPGGLLSVAPCLASGQANPTELAPVSLP